ncbi:MAG: ion transporter [Thermoanaerobaculia bacterium]
MIDRLRSRVHEYLEAPPVSLGPRVVQLGITALIALNVAAVVVGTVSTEAEGAWAPLEERYAIAFGLLEQVSVAVFSAEYLLRLWSATADPRFARPLLGRVRYALTPMAIVDLLAILPSFFAASGFLAVRALRLVRVFRIFKLARYSVALKTLRAVLLAKRAELCLTVFLIGILLVLVSTALYYLEHQAQPDKFSSIPATMWWGIVTLTTVGYGDISPLTPLGKLMAGVAAVFGIGIVALPAAILGSAFIQELEAGRRPARCPHCGKELGGYPSAAEPGK